MKKLVFAFLLALCAVGHAQVVTSGGTSANIRPTGTNTAATSGNVNFVPGVYHANPSGASTAVYSGVLGQIYSDSTGAGITSPGHTIGVFGYNIVNKSQDLAIATEGKLKVGTTGVTLASGASVHCGLEDVVSGATVTSWTGCNSVITQNHGTISTGKGFDFGVTAASSAIGNLFAYNAQDVSASLATNYGGFRCQVTAATGHYCIYADGSAPNYLAGHLIAGSATAPSISSGCGTSPSITGRDEAMLITVGTGGSATSCTVAFGTSYSTNAPVCVPISNSDTGLLMTTATNGLTVSKGTALTAGSKISVICRGWL